MLKLADHDFMSGEHIEINSGMIVTSGKWLIWPIVAPENQGFRRLRKDPKRGKNSWAKLIKKHMWGGSTLPSMLGKRLRNFVLNLMNTTVLVWGKRILLVFEGHCWRGDLNSSSCIHGQGKVWTGQVDLLPFPMVGRNVAAPFIFL
jgi:hypothetical protein